MKPNAAERRSVDAAETLAQTLGRNPNHTVAAAVIDIDGTIHQAVNVYHFTGGPCAELVALGVAATAGATRLLAIAAAGDGGRGLLPPCGRCRQVFLDQHPDILVAVPGSDGPTMRPIHKLLPDAYFSPDKATNRIVRFSGRYLDAVRSEEKTTTVRWDDPVALGRASFVFEDREDFAHLDGEVLGIEFLPAHYFDEEYLAQLRAYYPDLPSDAELTRVTFCVVGA